MRHEDRKALKQNVVSMPRDNKRQIEIQRGAGELGKKVFKVAEWKSKCESYFNRYFKTLSIILVPFDSDKIMDTLSFLCSDNKSRGFVFKNYNSKTFRVSRLQQEDTNRKTWRDTNEQKYLIYCIC